MGKPISPRLARLIIRRLGPNLSRGRRTNAAARRGHPGQCDPRPHRAEACERGAMSSGQIGACYIRWPDGHRAVLTWQPQSTVAELQRGPLAVVDALRDAGYSGTGRRARSPGRQCGRAGPPTPARHEARSPRPGPARPGPGAQRPASRSARRSTRDPNHPPVSTHRRPGLLLHARCASTAPAPALSNSASLRSVPAIPNT